VKQLTYVDKADNQTKTSYKIAITFRSKRLPQTIIVSRVIRHVSPFLHEIRFCKNCGFYGHLFQKCNRKPGTFCGKCFSRDHKTCTLKTFCKHCGTTDHNTNDQHCPERQRQEKMQKVMSINNVGFNEAKKILNQKTQSRRPPTIYDTTQFPSLQKPTGTKNATNSKNLLNVPSSANTEKWGTPNSHFATPTESRKRRRPQKPNDFQKNPWRYLVKPVELESLKPVLNGLVETITKKEEFKGQETLVRDVLRCAAFVLMQCLEEKTVPNNPEEEAYESASESQGVNSPEKKKPLTNQAKIMQENSRFYSASQ
jgi:hypothetical protein